MKAKAKKSVWSKIETEYGFDAMMDCSAACDSLESTLERTATSWINTVQRTAKIDRSLIVAIAVETLASVQRDILESNESGL